MSKPVFPEWLKVKVNINGLRKINSIVSNYSLHTVCNEASCPNIGECFGINTATFLILGNRCTRNCKFCRIMNEQPLRVDGDEPERIAGAVVELRLSHVVVTSVTRDDLEDGGASHFFKTVKAIHRHSKMTSVEVLVPDFNGNEKSLNTVLEAKVDVLGHNIETVASLYGTVRPGANYERSLSLLSKAKKTDSNIITKSGFMVGLGETANEVFELMKDLKDTGCDILTIGQYLKPSRKHMDVVEYVHPDIFKEYKQKAYQIGFKHVESGPLVRSSYRSSEAYKRCRQLTVNPHM